MPTLLEKIEANAAKRLALPAGSKTRLDVARYKTFLKVETHRLKILHRAGGEGREICRARASIIDLLLRYLLKDVQNAPPSPPKRPRRFSPHRPGRLRAGGAQSPQRY